MFCFWTFCQQVKQKLDEQQQKFSNKQQLYWIKQSLEGNTNYITDPLNLEKQFQTHARNNYLSNNGDYRKMIKKMKHTKKIALFIILAALYYSWVLFETKYVSPHLYQLSLDHIKAMRKDIKDLKEVDILASLVS